MKQGEFYLMVWMEYDQRWAFYHREAVSLGDGVLNDARREARALFPPHNPTKWRIIQVADGDR